MTLPTGDLVGLAALVTAFLSPLTTILVIVLLRRTLQEISRQTTAIDLAVNSKLPGEPSISDNVDVIMEKQERDKPTR